MADLPDFPTLPNAIRELNRKCTLASGWAIHAVDRGNDAPVLYRVSGKVLPRRADGTRPRRGARPFTASDTSVEVAIVLACLAMRDAEQP